MRADHFIPRRSAGSNSEITTTIAAHVASRVGRCCGGRLSQRRPLSNEETEREAAGRLAFEQ